MQLIAKIKNWGINTFISVFDQGILSSTNFFLNIYLSRKLDAENYGLFAVVFTIYLLIFIINQSIILEPLAIIGSKNKNGKNAYLKILILLQLVLSLIISISLYIVSYFFFSKKVELQSTIYSLAFIIPFLSLFHLLRRFCYLQLRPAIAFFSSVLYVTSMIISFFIIEYIFKLNAYFVFLLQGISSIVPIVYLFIHFKLFSKIGMDVFAEFRKTLVYHIKLGKWLLASSTISWLSTSLFYPLIASFKSIQFSAVLKSMDNVLLPMQQIITAISLFLIPKISIQSIGNDIFLSKMTKKITLLMLFFVIAYIVFLTLFHKYIFFFLYGHQNPYNSYSWILPIAALPLLGRAITDIGIGIFFRVKERFDFFLKTTVIYALASISLGIYLTINYGVFGTELAFAIATLFQIIFTFYTYNRFKNNIQ